MSRDRRGPSRLWLVLPLLLAAVVVAGWCGWWFVGRSRIEAAIDQAAQAHQAEGRALAWERRTVGGFPFRYAIRFEGLRFASPSGWAVEARRAEVQANAYQLTRWVAVAPEGLTLVRPEAGPVEIKGREIRASLTGVDQPIPRFALEGVNLTFTPRAGA
ncbi:MAG TPA: DUF2125 domain-containing protein, partial [Roseococcus sp.]|nr:DUF2125 domain-containing protein [Roseococcus sp.]